MNTSAELVTPDTGNFLMNETSKIKELGQTDLLKPTYIFPAFLPYEISKPVARSNFEKRCNGRRTSCTSRTPTYVFRSQKDESSIL